jgi:hypothetical protein
MRWQRTVTVVGAHAEGEIGRVIVGGVLPPPGATMFERMKYLETKGDDLRQMLLFDPRGGVTVSMNLVLPPCDSRADVGLIIMESRHYVPMSGSNTICTVTVLLETGMILMREPETVIVLDTPGGLVQVTAACRNGKCERVTFRNVPSFVFALDRSVEVQGLGTVKVDVSYGGLSAPKPAISSRSASASRLRRPSKFRPSIRKTLRSTPLIRRCLPARSRIVGRERRLVTRSSCHRGGSIAHLAAPAPAPVSPFCMPRA